MQQLNLSENVRDRYRERLEMVEALESREQLKQMTIKDFITLAVIGQGSFGKVTLVKKRSSGQILAMKIMSKQMMVTKKQVMHVRAERNILSKHATENNCNHDYLVKLFYSFHDRENLYLVMEFLPGGDLMNFANERGCSFGSCH